MSSATTLVSEEWRGKRLEIYEIIRKLALKKPVKKIPVPEQLLGWSEIINNPIRCMFCQLCEPECEQKAISAKNILNLSEIATYTAEELQELPENHRLFMSLVQKLTANGSNPSKIEFPLLSIFPLGKVDLEPKLCISCEKCKEVCPYESMVRTGYFDLPAIFEGYEILKRESKKTSGDFEPLIICYFCQWCTYASADLAGTSRMQYPPNVRIIKLPCTGKVDPLYVLKAFELGADGVVVSGCLYQQCHYIDGNYKAEKRITFLKDVLEEIGFGGNRLSMHFISASMAPTLVETIKEAVTRIKKLGPNPIK